AVLHLDQSQLAAGQLRVVLSVRGIGEGHLSCIGFVEALIGPGPRWTFQPRQLPAVAASSSPGLVRRDHLRARLLDLGPLNGLARSVLGSLPDEFTSGDLEEAIAGVASTLLVPPAATATVDALRRMVSATYQVRFPQEVALSQQVLMPATPQESHGVEDARFVRFTAEDGTVEYRGTYTAYDGRRIEPRLILSPDLRTFRSEGLAGPAAHSKGMAIFPRKINGRYVSLCRSDGESTGVSTSPDGIRWDTPTTVQVPNDFWALLQVGNCGPPLETEHGWLVLTHGVGPMRVYSVGAVLLDLDDPTKMIKSLAEPLLQTTAADRDGYVPNVVYSCGGIIHDGRLWVPHGIGDSRIGVAWVDVAELVASMTDVAPGSARTPVAG
ncbi:MAG: glycosylase, partial [Actinomycetota bacterium]|nr:glycosylase [Actinomycetota bacterium]